VGPGASDLERGRYELTAWASARRLL
jgi:hypothetical protein